MSHPFPVDPGVAELARAVQMRPVRLELSDVEFNGYVVALATYWHRSTRSDAEWKAVGRALDVLKDLRRELNGDSVDSAHLRACWERRRVLPAPEETYRLELRGEAGEVIVLALADYGAGSDDGEADGEAGRELRTAAREVITRVRAALAGAS